MPSNDLNSSRTNPNFRTLGGLWAVYGVIRLILALCLILYSGTATLMFGALLNRVADPFTWMGIFHFLYAVLIILSIVSGLLAIVAGVALLGGQQSARKLAVVAAILSLSDIPLGITLGTYTLVRMLTINTLALNDRFRQAA